MVEIEAKLIKEFDLLQVNSESKLIEVLDRANLSDRELDELPFDISTTFSRFFDAGLAQTKDNIIYFKTRIVIKIIYYYFFIILFNMRFVK